MNRDADNGLVSTSPLGTPGNWGPLTSESNLYLYVTGKNYTITVNDKKFTASWDPETKSFSMDDYQESLYEIISSVSPEDAGMLTFAADGSAVEVADNTFTMPAETVTVSQNFVNIAKNVTVSLQTITTGLGDRIAMPITVTGDIAALCVTKLILKVSYISVRGIFSITPKATFYSFAVWYTLNNVRIYLYIF